MLISKCHSDGPSAGPTEASGLPEAHGPPHGPPKSMGLGVIVPPAPPLGGPDCHHRQRSSVERVKFSVASVLVLGSLFELVT